MPALRQVTESLKKKKKAAVLPMKTWPTQVIPLKGITAHYCILIFVCAIVNVRTHDGIPTIFKSLWVGIFFVHKQYYDQREIGKKMTKLYDEETKVGIYYSKHVY